MALLAGYGPAWSLAVAVQPVFGSSGDNGVNDATVDGMSMLICPRSASCDEWLVTTTAAVIAKNNRVMPAENRGYGDLIALIALARWLQQRNLRLCLGRPSGRCQPRQDGLRNAAGARGTGERRELTRRKPP